MWFLGRQYGSSLLSMECYAEDDFHISFALYCSNIYQWKQHIGTLSGANDHGQISLLLNSVQFFV